MEWRFISVSIELTIYIGTIIDENFYHFQMTWNWRDFILKKRLLLFLSGQLSLEIWLKVWLYHFQPPYEVAFLLYKCHHISWPHFQSKSSRFPRYLRNKMEITNCIANFIETKEFMDETPMQTATEAIGYIAAYVLILPSIIRSHGRWYMRSHSEMNVRTQTLTSSVCVQHTKMLVHRYVSLHQRLCERMLDGRTNA